MRGMCSFAQTQSSDLDNLLLHTTPFGLVTAVSAGFRINRKTL